tara:strand:+ start:335 stop:739 length:405 start_codon:yes stop_codon:yes gene_type:complete
MFKKLFFLPVFFAIYFISIASSYSQSNETYINLFISKDKTIYLETEKIGFDEVESKVSEIIRKMPFKLDRTIVYRIFGDENLKLGYIMDVNNKMLAAYDDNVRTNRYLLNTVQLNIDGQNWFQSIEMKNLKKVN